MLRSSVTFHNLILFFPVPYLISSSMNLSFRSFYQRTPKTRQNHYRFSLFNPPLSFHVPRPLLYPARSIFHHNFSLVHTLKRSLNSREIRPGSLVKNRREQGLGMIARKLLTRRIAPKLVLNVLELAGLVFWGGVKWLMVVDKRQLLALLPSLISSFQMKRTGFKCERCWRTSSCTAQHRVYLSVFNENF